MRLLKNNDYEFQVIKDFDVKYLEPILQNMLWKVKNQWDDYNEFYHCCCLVETIQKTNNSFIDTHIINKEGKQVGVVLIIGGQIDFNNYLKVELKKEVFNENNVMLNYFHIVPQVRGIGEKWLKEIIIPYYKNLGVKNIYLKSSHEKSFSLYKRIGSEIGNYFTYSDNQLFTRQGKVFQIEI